ncbi:aldo/keto reductase [Actinopolymorpha sp. B11F2]|uniref:aldo/keto reductase n=1 Tax=Actinopolymorpha sp. B11F2 TaxID=3160862 RepID=UPI0032E473B9
MPGTSRGRAAAAALRFPLRQPAVRSVLVGAHLPGQIRANMNAFARDIPDEFWADLERVLP